MEREAWSTRLGPLAEPQFRLLWLARTSSALGTGLVPVALAFAILEDLDGSASQLGLALAAFSGSRVVFTLVGGVYADRLDRRRVMLVCDLLSAAVELVVFALLLTENLGIVGFAAAMAFFGGTSAFFGPASTGLVAETVSPPRLQQANALVGMSISAADIVGPALGGILVATVGPAWAFGIDAVSFLVSAAFMVALRVAPRAVAARQTFVADLVAGWRAVAARTWLLASFAGFAISNLCGATFFVLGPVVFAEELGGASDWGLVMSLAAAGGFAGGALALRVRPRRPLVFAFAVWVATAGPPLALVQPLPTLAVGLAAALSFAGGMLGNAVWESTLQRHIPAEILARVSSYDWLVSLVFTPLGFALVGPVAGAVGVEVTLLATGALAVACHLAVLVVPSVRKLRREPEPSPARRARAEAA